MQLNPDCIRALLMYFEERTDESIITCDVETISQVINFPQDVVEYHIQQCNYNDFLIGYKPFAGGFALKDISPSAHEFLANIRSDTIWKKIKKVAVQIGTSSLPSLIQLSEKFVTQLIQSHIFQ